MLNSSKIRIERLSLVFITLLPAASHEFLFKYTDQKTDQFEVTELVFRQLPVLSLFNFSQLMDRILNQSI
jgi:hypothetical protein